MDISNELSKKSFADISKKSCQDSVNEQPSSSVRGSIRVVSPNNDERKMSKKVISQVCLDIIKKKDIYVDPTLEERVIIVGNNNNTGNKAGVKVVKIVKKDTYNYRPG